MNRQACNLLVILGPTASGKTRMGVGAARALDGEIVSADSRQVYRGMDLGTGKDLAEYGEVPYHLIDIVEPGHEFSLFEFQRRFFEAFEDIRRRGRMPILVGGTGLYLEAVLKGYRLVEVPENPALREQLAHLDMTALVVRLQRRRPDLHNTTDLLDRQRLVRAIEIAEGEEKAGAGLPPLPVLRPLVFGVRWERAKLRLRITARLKERLEEGLIEEVARLHGEGVPWATLEFYGLEYRFIARHLQGELSRNDMFQKLNSAIHRFAKRQETWYRRTERQGTKIHWLDGAGEPLSELLNTFRGGCVKSRPASAMPAEVARYRRCRAAVGPWRIEGTDCRDFTGAVVIPALAESASVFATLESLAQNPPELLRRFLILVVVNHREDALSADKVDNLALLESLKGGTPRELQLAWVDAASGGLALPAGEGGVGLARKIGFDLALEHLDFGGPPPLLIALDADTLVRPDYLPAIVRHFETAWEGGAVLPFRHQQGATPAEEEAICRYELFLRHYVLGLSLAGSPYAFHTVGSTMACRAEAYVRAGGMNRRRAGEDFYFLQQLSKSSGVAPLKGTTVFPSARPSHRTPFGTGRSVARQLERKEDAVRFYRPECFRLLGNWLALATESWDAPGIEVWSRARTLSVHLAEYLESAAFVPIWSKLQQNHRRRESFLAGFHGWFDGLKTLKLIHHLCADPLPKVDPEQSLPSLLRWAELDPAGSSANHLARLRAHQTDENFTKSPLSG